HGESVRVGWSRRPALPKRQGGLGSSQGRIIIRRIALIDFSRVTDMAPAKPIVEKKRRYFTVEEANKALPLVRMILGDIVHQYRVVDDLQQRLAVVSRERRRPSTDLYSEELAQSQAELEAEETKLRSYIDELRR